MRLGRRVLDHFVLPAAAIDPAAAGSQTRVRADEATEQAGAGSGPRTPSGVAVLSAAPDALALGGALGLALACRHGAPAVAVCVWTGADASQPTWRAPALPAARRLAHALAARGLAVTPAGRLALVRLPAGCEEAAAEARRGVGAAASAPSVVAIGGPRAAAFDVLLAELDLVVVATRTGIDPALARLALADLGQTTARACACEVPATPPARALAAAGIALLPSARRALAGPLEAMG